MSNFFLLAFFGALAIGNHPSDGGAVVDFQPEFAEPLENVTVPLGRDATFTCIVRGLAGYRVGWVRADSKAIQAIHTHVITHNSRVSVSHSDHTMWHLHIKGVKEEDRGSYMCQINTDPMISQISYLEVVIPPDFIPEETSSDLMIPEGSPVKLTCNARGHPTPNITWRRENGQNITLKSPSGAKAHVSVYEGNVLRLLKVSRADMGPYLCIASNAVPPSISKRIMVSVHFHPVIHVPNQLVGAPLNTDVTLECNVEAFPRSIHFWMKDSGSMIISGERFEVREVTKSMFEVKMILIIKNFRRSDAGTFHCIAKNSLGDVDSIVKLQDLKSINDEVGGSKSRSDGKSVGNESEEDEDDDEYDDDDDEETILVPKLKGASSSHFNNHVYNNVGGRKLGEQRRAKSTASSAHQQNNFKQTSQSGSNKIQTVVVPVNNRESNLEASDASPIFSAINLAVLSPAFYLLLLLLH